MTTTIHVENPEAVLRAEAPLPKCETRLHVEAEGRPARILDIVG